MGDTRSARIHWHDGSGGGEGDWNNLNINHIECIPNLEDFGGNQQIRVITDDIMREADTQWWTSLQKTLTT